MIDKNTMVILDTPMRITPKVENGERVVFASTYSQYEFSLDDALHYASEVNPYVMYDLIYHNIPLRDELRQVGMTALASRLKQLRPQDKRLAEVIDGCADSWQDRAVADFDIQLHPVTRLVEICGHAFHGLDEIAGLVEVAAGGRGEPYLTRRQVDDVGVHVGEASFRYPCFDCYDDAGEDRYYCNYIIRDHPITDREVRSLHSIRPSRDECRLHEFTPASMLPMAYYSGDGGFMLVATARREREK